MSAPGGSGPSLRVRIFGAMALVVLAGAGTLMIVSLIVAPGVFYRHLQQAGVAQDPTVTTHVADGFALATVVSAVVGVVIAGAVAAAMAVLVSRRIATPVTTTADAAGRPGSDRAAAAGRRAPGGGAALGESQTIRHQAGRGQKNAGQEGGRPQVSASERRCPRAKSAAADATFRTNKYAITLNLRSPKGREVAKRLAVWADVVLENFRVGEMEKWGLGYEEIKKIKPDIIMASTNMLGQYGRHNMSRGYGHHGVGDGGGNEAGDKEAEQ